MKFLKKVSKPISLISFLHGNMSQYDEHRGVETIHGSDLTKDEGFCPREYALLHHLGKYKKGMTIAAPLRHTFDMGRDIEARVQNEYLLDEAVGHWKCQSCGDQKNFCKKPKAGCDREDINCIWRYEEVKIKHGNLICSPDLFVDVHKGKLKMVELKTMIKEQFTDLKAPLAEHRLRTQFYLWMVAKSGYSEDVNTKEAIILYIAKSYGKMNEAVGTITPFKEYVIKRDDEGLAEILLGAARYEQYRQKGKMPKGICPNSKCKRAKSCTVSKECFGGKFKPGTKVKI